MNNKRRTRLKKAKSYIDVAISIIEMVMGEEEEAFDNFPDSIKDGERGDQMQDNLDILCNITDNLETAIDGIDELL